MIRRISAFLGIVCLLALVALLLWEVRAHRMHSFPRNSAGELSVRYSASPDSTFLS